jgi:hypothetical protein
MTLRPFFNLQAFFALSFSAVFFFLTGNVEFQKSKARGDTGYELTPPFYKALSAGFWPVVADALWIRTLQEIGEQSHSRQSTEESARDYRILQNLDPLFFSSYEQASIHFSVVVNEPDLAIESLNRGIEVYETGRVPQGLWSSAFLLYIYRAYVKGVIQLDFKGARLDFLKASEIEGAPRYLSKMKIWLKEEGSDRRLARNILKQLISSTRNSDAKAKYLEQLKAYEP